MRINRLEAFLVARVLREKAAKHDQLLGDQSGMKKLLEAVAGSLERFEGLRVEQTRRMHDQGDR